MTTVAQAEHIILQQVTDYGTESIPFQEALGRILAEDLLADRDQPACNRATMDGIALNFSAFEKGLRDFNIKIIQAAGDEPIELAAADECIEIMTGAALPATANTVIRYEDITIQNGVATLQTENTRSGQNVHKKGADKKAGELIVGANALVSPTVISAAAFIGKENLQVKKNPKVIVFSTGDELTAVHETPADYKIRGTNTYAIKAALAQHQLNADIEHLPDDEDIIEQRLGDCINSYDAIIICGGISMGKYDYVGKVLERLAVKQLFYKVQQRPGKPFWFGVHEKGTKVFAFPGNPASAFMCLHRYFIPWHKACLGLETIEWHAQLGADFHFEPDLRYFLQVKLHMNEEAQLVAMPIAGNGSGDLSNLAETDAFMELPSEHNNFKKGEVYRIWPYKQIFI